MPFFKPEENIEILPPPEPFPSLVMDSEKTDFSDKIIEQESPEIKVIEIDDLTQSFSTKKSGRTGISRADSKKLKAKIKNLEKTAKNSNYAHQFEDDLINETLTEKSEFKKIFSGKKNNNVESLTLPAVDSHFNDFRFAEKEFIQNGFVMDVKTENSRKIKPKEVIEAEEEIKSAIESIKKIERPSFLKKLFGRKSTEASVSVHNEKPIDKNSFIKKCIFDARQALMEYDIESARKFYIEAVQAYNSLTPREQLRYYKEIKEIYFERKNAEELKAI